MQTFIIVIVLFILLVLMSVVVYHIYKTLKSSDVVTVTLNSQGVSSEDTVSEIRKTTSNVMLPPSLDVSQDQFNTLSYIYSQPPPLPYPGYVFPPAGYPYPFSYNSKQLGGGFYYHGDGRRRR